MTLGRLMLTAAIEVVRPWDYRRTFYIKTRSERLGFEKTIGGVCTLKSAGMI